jgi:hypothetical protein
MAMDDMDERDERERDRERKLPEFERDDERTVGGGLMSQGGTATDRGTGELDGTAQGETDDDEDETTEGLTDDAGPSGRIFAGPPAGGGAPYLGAFVDPDAVAEDGGDRG